MLNRDVAAVRTVVLAILLLISSIFFAFLYLPHENQKRNVNALVDRNYPESALPSPTGPILKDPNLRAEVVFRGLKYPTDMAFLAANDILVTEKDTGIVKRIVNGVLLKDPLLDVNVETFGHRGLLGIAISNTSSSSLSNYTAHGKIITPKNNSMKYVFLYYTAAQAQDSEDITQGKQPLGNVVYRYEFVNNTRLINPKLLLDLPAIPGAIGNGGKILVNPYDGDDDNDNIFLYITIGGVGIDGHKTKAQNVKNGGEPDGTSGILVITQDGKAISQQQQQQQQQQIAKLGNNNSNNKDSISKYYYAYGIWNSFGIDFDPVTKKLWDTENGVVFGDEINLVEPGFNSGWNKIDGIWLRGYPIGETEAHHIATNQTIDNLLIDFNGKGKYSPPEFTWFDDVGPTAIRFFNSDKLGKQYQNDMFVGDIINGNIYHFDLNKQRTELLFPPNSPYSDKVLNSNETRFNDEIIFGKGFGGITDIAVGPDGYLYILTFNKEQGTIYRIIAARANDENS